MKKITLNQILKPQKPLKIHIIACAGHLSAPLALELKRLGHQITGSDQEKIYPPADLILKKAKIIPNQNKLTPHIDLVIIGGGAGKHPNIKLDLKKSKELSLSTISLSNFVSSFIGKKNSILICGTYGKTTITALITKILKDQGFNPSYMFGTPSFNLSSSLRINNSPWSVLEGDESIHGQDRQAKFLYYPKKYVIITSTDWEHKDSYPSAKANLSAYQKLVRQIPPQGCLIINRKDPNALLLKKLSSAPVIFYNQKKAIYQTPLLGQYNQENIDAVFTLCKYLNLDKKKTKKSIADFTGLKRRLENLGEYKKILFYDDFAQSAPRLKSALSALSQKYPQRKIKVFFEPHASYLQYQKNLSDLKTAFQKSQEVVLAKISFDQKLRKQERATFMDYQKVLKNKVKYFPIYQQIFDHYQKTLNPNDLLVHFSSGGQDGLKTLKKIINHFK
jgi:UDP-N-acetylmuramate: L-alanyl-gamma-D-glutamyl-meso-diaminopimelate ligase